MARDLVKLHPIRLEGNASFSVDDDGRSVAEIENLIRFLQPDILKRAGASYRAAATKLTALNSGLVTWATEMAKVWEGTSSVEAQQALRTLHATNRELAAKFTSMGQSLEWLAERLREHQDFVANERGAWSDNTYTIDDSVAKWVHTMDKGREFGSQDEMAGQHLRLLNDDLLKVYQGWPAQVTEVVPDIKPPALPAPDLRMPGGPGNVEVPAGPHRLPGGDLQGPGLDGLPSTDPDRSGLPDGAVDPGGTSLDGTYPEGGFNPVSISPDGTYPGRTPDGQYRDGTADSQYPGATPGSQYPGGTHPSGNPSGSSFPNGADLADVPLDSTGPGLPTGTGTPDPSGLTGPDPRTALEDFQRPAAWDPGTSAAPNGASPYSTPGTGTGTGGNATGMGGLPLNARSASATGGHMPFLPMGGMGAPTESERKENNTWLHEDDDVWGGEADDAVSGKIG